jgi:REP element-mobilizing transposase RayT
MREYRRHLPHQVPDETPIFLTWNLKGAVPRDVVLRLQRERERLVAEPPRKAESARDRALRRGKLIFAREDDFLDRAITGPLHLRDSAAAKIVEDAIIFGAQERYELFAWCVMANHVHLLILPLCELPKITQSLKGYTAHQINGLHEARGRVFWQDESYDHWVRDEDELLRIIAYIENNPVKAGRCERPESWPWSSARFRPLWPTGEPYRRSAFPG